MAETSEPRVLIICENASEKMGGEAILPLHYFRFLRRRGIFVKLITHERVSQELREILGEDFMHVYLVSDTPLQKLLHVVSQFLPRRVADVTTRYLISISSGRRQRRLARGIVKGHSIDVVHQPTPVSPKLPSQIFDVGAPVIIGPMNGGMTFPRAFRSIPNVSERLAIWLGKTIFPIFHYVIPGKRKARLLLVANERTRTVLPKSVVGKTRIIQIVENGVDLKLWRKAGDDVVADQEATKFVFLGFLKDWKGVNFLLYALKEILKHRKIRLEIIGTGPEEPKLKQLTRQLGLESHVQFLGFIPQKDCPEHLADARALILPSLYECGGAAVLEAMAMGKPVIATAWGGPLDYLTPDCGILVTPSSREAFIGGLVEAMSQLSSDADLARRLGEKGFERVKSNFNWETKIEEMIELYRSVTNE